jgi:hypothetical protein
MNKRTTIIGASALALAGAGAGAGVGVALAGTSPAATPAASHAALANQDISLSAGSLLGRHGGGRIRCELRAQLRAMLRHAEHAEFIVDTPKHGFVTVDIDRGLLDSASSSSIEITRRDGHNVSATVTSSTHFFGLKEAKLAKGDRVILVQVGGDAIDVAAFPPKSPTSAVS